MKIRTLLTAAVALLATGCADGAPTAPPATPDGAANVLGVYGSGLSSNRSIEVTCHSFTSAGLETNRLPVGGTGFCHATAYQGGNEAAFADVLTWTSSDPSTISVSQTGTITAHKAGSARISVSDLDANSSVWVVAY